MSWKPTLWLMSLALALFAFILLFERHKTPTAMGAAPPKRLLTLRPAEVTNIQLRVTNQLVLRAERATNGHWNLVAPMFFPAEAYAIEGLLGALSEVTSPTSLALDELGSGKTVADFGLDVPQSTLTLLHEGRRTEILFGAKTPGGNQIYVQLLNQPAIYVINAEIMNRLPRQFNDWRDTALFKFAGLPWDRLDVRLPGGRGFALHRDPTNNFQLARPMVARADVAKVEMLLRKLADARVQEFVTDEPRIDLEPYGLQPAEAELALGLGSNDVAVVQFGKSPTNRPGLLYARQANHTNVVLVPKTILETLQAQPSDMRDHHLFSFSTNEVDVMEVTSPEPFALRRQGNGPWAVTEPQPAPVDPELIRDLLFAFQLLEGHEEKDLVTDFASFGLTTPARQYLLKTTFTNSAGAVTNRIVSQLDMSAPQAGKVFVRRGDESLSVYSISAAQFEALPYAAWQLRDRRVWSFTTNQVAQLTVSRRGASRTLTRSPAGKWSLAEGSQGIINTSAIEEMMYRLGELRAEMWVARGETNRVQYGFTGEGARLTIDLKIGDKPNKLNLELGGATAAQFPFALANVDGQTWIFKFPLALYVDLLRYVITPLTQ